MALVDLVRWLHAAGPLYSSRNYLFCKRGSLGPVLCLRVSLYGDVCACVRACVRLCLCVCVVLGGGGAKFTKWRCGPVSRLALTAGPLSKEQMEKLVERDRIFQRSAKEKAVGDMLPATRLILTDFYRRYNAELADMLGDERYLWL